MADSTRNAIILGSGPTGLTAAIYLARASLRPLVIAGQAWGGQLMDTTAVENFPGFRESIMGPDLMQQMRAQAERFGAEFLEANATAVNVQHKPFSVTTDGHEYLAHTLVIATGASAKWLGLPSEARYKGHGVSACATCDGFFFKGKKVAVVGGGDASMEEAIFLTRFASEVVLIVRAPDEAHLRASVYMREKLKATPKASIRYQTEVAEVLGEPSTPLGPGSMTGLKLRNNVTGAEADEAYGGLFVAIGHAPNTELFKGQLELEPKAGYLVVKNMVHSSVEGVFIGGDVADWRYRQAVTAAGFGCMAALEAEKYLTHCGLPHSQ